MRGIEQVRVFSLFQGRGGALAVAFVPFDDVGQHRGLVDIPPLGLVFGGPAAGAHLLRSRHVDFNVGIRADDGADIAAVEYRAGRLGGEIALEGQQRRAHLGDGGDHRSRLAHRMGLEGEFIEARRVERLGGGNRGGFVVRAAASIEHALRHRAIDQPGVEMAQSVMRGQPFAERALARGRRSVDGDDHDRSAPSERISSTKPGKLVAMKAPSSMRTGLSLAKPITSAAMALRCSMWVKNSPPPAALALPCTIRSSPSISTVKPLARSMAAVASNRSDSLTRNSFRPRRRVTPCANEAATARIGYSSIIAGARSAGTRSEEHTSELQSLRHLVCRLLLEK